MFRMLLRFQCPLIGLADQSSQEKATKLIDNWLADRSAKALQYLIFKDTLAVITSAPRGNFSLDDTHGLTHEYISMRLCEAVEISRMITVPAFSEEVN